MQGLPINRRGSIPEDTRNVKHIHFNCPEGVRTPSLKVFLYLPTQESFQPFLQELIRNTVTDDTVQSVSVQKEGTSQSLLYNGERINTNTLFDGSKNQACENVEDQLLVKG